MSCFWSRPYIGVIVPTITGREEQFERCMKTLNKAMDRGFRYVDIDIITKKDSTREEIIRDTDLSGFDWILFVDDDDYVTPSIFENCFTQEKINMMILNRTAITPMGCAVYEKASVGYGENSLFDINKVRNSKGASAPIWYVTGVFFKASIIRAFKKEILSKYDIKGCWEDLMYWAFIEKKYPNLKTKYAPEGAYIQVCLKDSLTRNNKQKNVQMNYNINLVKEYLLSTGMTSDEIDECMKKVNRCKTNKYGTYGYKLYKEGSVKVLSLRHTSWLLESELEEIGFRYSFYSYYGFKVETFKSNQYHELPKSYDEWLGEGEKVVIRMDFDNFDNEAEFKNSANGFDIFKCEKSDMNSTYYPFARCETEIDSFRTILYKVENGSRVTCLYYWNKAELIKYLKPERVYLESIYPREFVDRLYAEIAQVREFNENWWNEAPVVETLNVQDNNV